MKKKKIHVIVDVEASGPVPGLFDIISIGIVVLEPGLNRTFYGEFAPLHDAFQQGAYDAIGVTREQHLAMPVAWDTMALLGTWLDEITDGGRVILISDNPAFDFMFAAWYCWRFLNRNPFGHSARRFGDFYAGLKRNWSQQQEWKRLRRTKHSHNSLDDAMGNAEAILTVFEQEGLKPVW